MSRLLFLIGGLVLGIGVGQTAYVHGPAAGGGAVVIVLVLVGLAWFGGQRDRASAVAVAVARAEATAAAVSEAQAAAIAQAAVHLHMTGIGGTVPDAAAIPEAAGSGSRPGRHQLGAPRRLQLEGRPVSADEFVYAWAERDLAHQQSSSHDGEVMTM